MLAPLPPEAELAPPAVDVEPDGTQSPLSQTPAEHGVPSALESYTQPPEAGLQEPPCWHSFGASHVTGEPGSHTPSSHESFMLHASPSSQAVFEMGWQSPSADEPPAVEHAKQGSSHADSQHTPSTHVWPSKHCAVVWQLVPNVE